MITLMMAHIGRSQSIIHPDDGNAITTIQEGSTYHYYDSGGANGDYKPVSNSLITIYPSKAGQYVSVSCKSFYLMPHTTLFIFDGNHPGAPIIGYFGDAIKTVNIRPGARFTASDKNHSGALSFRFVSKNIYSTASGWDFAVTSSSSAGKAPTQTTQDCSGAIKVCSDSAITTKSQGSGYQELPGPDPMHKKLNYEIDGENQSNWYKFEVANSGTIEFLIKPHKHTDFDWALWGPYKSNQCPAWTTDIPIRASAADGRKSKTGNTGLSSQGGDIREGSGGDGFVAPIPVQAGEHYVLMIDDWSGNRTTFDLEWTLLGGALLECAIDEEVDSIPTKEEIEEFQIEIEIDSTAQVVEEVIIPSGPKLEADISTDQKFVTVSYPGAFEFKIENSESRTVLTGHAVNSDEVEITRLPPGTYRVSLIYKQIKQYTTFVKD